MTRLTPLRSTALAALITALAIVPARAQSSAVYADRWTATRGSIEIELPNATISIRGTNDDSVRVEIRAQSNELVPLPILQRTSNGFRLSDADNPIALEVEIWLPERFNAQLKGSNGGAIMVDGLHGALSVENSNAGVTIEGAHGPVLASSSNGAIEVGIEELVPDGPYSLVTSNAPVTLTLFDPAPNADLHLETENGRILTDYELTSWPGVERISEAVEAGRVLRAILGSGGPLIRIRTDNGDIRLRSPTAGPAGGLK